MVLVEWGREMERIFGTARDYLPGDLVNVVAGTCETIDVSVMKKTRASVGGHLVLQDRRVLLGVIFQDLQLIDRPIANLVEIGRIRGTIHGVEFV